MLRRYVAKMTGWSRAQLTRLIDSYRECGRPRHPCRFAQRYTRADVELLDSVEEAHET
jgi:hypothetical protein